jgi:hypothetical protein
MMTSKRLSGALMVTAAGLLLAGVAWADDSRGSDLKRLSAEFQNSTSVGGGPERYLRTQRRGRTAAAGRRYIKRTSGSRTMWTCFTSLSRRKEMSTTGQHC